MGCVKPKMASCWSIVSHFISRGCRELPKFLCLRVWHALCAYAYAMLVVEALLTYVFVLPLLAILSGLLLSIDRGVIWCSKRTRRPESIKLCRSKRRTAIKEHRREAKHWDKRYKKFSSWEKCLWGVSRFLATILRCAFQMCYYLAVLWFLATILVVGQVACSLFYIAVRLALLAIAYGLAALIIWLWAVLIRGLILCALLRQHDKCDDGGITAYFAWRDRVESSKPAIVGCPCGRRRRLLGGSPKAIGADFVVHVNLEQYKRAGRRVDEYWRVLWGRQDVRVPVALGEAKDIAMKLAAMLQKRGPGRTAKSEVEAYRDELIAEALSHQQEEPAKAAGHEAIAGQLLSLGGLNIQWPFSQLILAGAKKVEVRKQALPYVARANEEMWLVETTNATLADAVVEGVDLPAKPPCAQIVGTITFAPSTPYDDRETFRADVSRHRIAEGSAHDWAGGGPRHAWHISSYRRLVTPIPYPGRKAMVGWTKKSPKSFPGIFVSGDAMCGDGQLHAPLQHQPPPTAKAPSKRIPCKRPLAGTDVLSTAKCAKVSSASSAPSAAGHGISSTSAAPSSNNSEGPMRHGIFAPQPFFQPQEGGWCGMHALNHYYGAPVVEKGDCLAAVREFAKRTGQREADHLFRESGWLSIEVMNILALTRVPQKHIEESARDWRELQAEDGVAAMVNWNQAHWTVLMHDLPRQTWVHINSSSGPHLRHGPKAGLSTADIDAILAEIQGAVGGVALHRTLASALAVRCVWVFWCWRSWRTSF